MRRMTFVTGFSLGYLLGAKAGRQRYEQIMRQLRRLAGQPVVHDAATAVKDEAIDLLSAAKGKVSTKIGGSEVTTESRDYAVTGHPYSPTTS